MQGERRGRHYHGLRYNYQRSVYLSQSKGLRRHLLMLSSSHHGKATPSASDFAHALQMLQILLPNITQKCRSRGSPASACTRAPNIAHASALCIPTACRSAYKEKISAAGPSGLRADKSCAAGCRSTLASSLQSPYQGAYTWRGILAPGR